MLDHLAGRHGHAEGQSDRVPVRLDRVLTTVAGDRMPVSVVADGRGPDGAGHHGRISWVSVGSPHDAAQEPRDLPRVLGPVNHQLRHHRPDS